MINVQAGTRRSLIKREWVGVSPTAIQCWTDAAGESFERVGSGKKG